LIQLRKEVEFNNLPSAYFMSSKFQKEAEQAEKAAVLLPPIGAAGDDDDEEEE
jgi:hypothetical protein